jgi:uncharacterized membrane protein YbjE (DUF340 family)
MLTVVLIMSAGILVGYFIRSSKSTLAVSERLIMWAIYLLLFLLGVAIGVNEIIINNLPLLGLKALIITAGGISGSVLLAWIGYHVWFKTKTNGDEE